MALSAFFARFPEVYAGDDQTVLLNEEGYEKLKDYHLWHSGSSEGSGSISRPPPGRRFAYKR